ncbi:MAG TPA: PilZ domain-containing protein [Candidatus Omnitrophota bacterium]|nr:PilZ domain-containing protein [Candidatus Omnitrophota bacterium]
MNKDRRKFKRFDAYMSIKFKSHDDKHLHGMSLSKDLCRDGLRINAPAVLQEGQLLDLEINIPDDPKTIHTAGRVMWARPSTGENQGFDHGVKLLEMDPVDKFRVLDYAYNYWLENKVTDFNDPEDSELIG